MVPESNFFQLSQSETSCEPCCIFGFLILDLQTFMNGSNHFLDKMSIKKYFLPISSTYKFDFAQVCHAMQSLSACL